MANAYPCVPGSYQILWVFEPADSLPPVEILLEKSLEGYRDRDRRMKQRQQ
jgi:hypothetical protein